jgi:hypothetical protein
MKYERELENIRDQLGENLRVVNLSPKRQIVIDLS